MTRLPSVLTGLLALAGISLVAACASDGGPSQAVATQPVVSSAPASTLARPTTAAPVATTDAPSTTQTVAADCTLTSQLSVGDVSPEVACLESHLLAEGMLVGIQPDAEFDATTETALKAFQKHHGLVVDGVLGPQTATQMHAWVGSDAPAPDPATCSAVGHSAVVDRYNQRAWLCDTGAITRTLPITSAWSQPDPGSYEVYAKEIEAASDFTGSVTTMTHFVAFAYGKNTGARIAFHSIPKDLDGAYIQPLASVGDGEQRGDSSGCIRVLPSDAESIWDWLQIGDTVTVVS
jgi:peptidoglycan hydrolase-like protein with peptidoglycan-binding domain